MKKIWSLFILVLSFSANAEMVLLFPSCRSGLGNDGECTLTNTSGKDVNCSLQISGYTRTGKYVIAYEFNKFLYSGMMTWARVYNPHFNDPITSLNANASCNTVR